MKIEMGREVEREEEDRWRREGGGIMGEGGRPGRVSYSLRGGGGRGERR